VPAALDPAGYDRIADAWAAARTAFTPGLERNLAALIAPLPPGASVLDAGCGSGRPVAHHLDARGLRVTGLDASAALLAHARANVPAATFLHGDLRTADPGGPFDALVAWDVLFHVPRADHAAVLQRFHGWLHPGGRLLMSAGGSASEDFTSEMFGVPFFYSGHAPEETLRLLAAAGFALERAEVDDPSSRGHVAIRAVRIPRTLRVPPPSHQAKGARS
jgi:cyclopropane fatty-acyl-phospholipid synthase-like methyltransferase